MIIFAYDISSYEPSSPNFERHPKVISGKVCRKHTLIEFKFDSDCAHKIWWICFLTYFLTQRLPSPTQPLRVAQSACVPNKPSQESQDSFLGIEIKTALQQKQRFPQLRYKITL